MTAMSFALENAFHSGTCVAIPRHVARAAELVRRVVGGATERVIKDYCLTDADGNVIGTVPAALNRPNLGSNHPTLYLQRES